MAALTPKPTVTGNDTWWPRVVLLQGLVQRVCLDLGPGRKLRHVALAVVAGEPAALVCECRHPSIVDHDGEAIFVDARLLAFLDDRVQLRVAVRLPFLAVEAHERMRLARIRVPRFPRGAEIGALVVVRNLEAQLDNAVLAINRRGLQRICLDQLVAELFLLVLMAGQAGPAAGDDRCAPGD